VRVPRLPDGQALLRRMFILNSPSSTLPVKRRARQNKAKPCRLPLPRRRHPLSRIPARRLLLPFSIRSGPMNRDQTAGAAALTTVVDAADAIAVGDARVAGAIGGQAAICRLQNMLRRGLLIHARVNLSRTSRPRLTISR
jgi:hypothetical protein